jgi:hypothetical protein
MLADEENALGRVGGENPFCDLDPAQRRQTDVQQNQIGLQRLCLLNGFGAIGGLTDNFPSDSCLQNPANMASPRFVVVYNQHTVCQFHETFSRGIFKQLRTAYARCFDNKLAYIWTGDCPNTRMSLRVPICSKQMIDLPISTWI